MREALGRGSILGYCTNVHAGPSLSESRFNLEQHALAVKARVSPGDPMGIGLWLSREAATDLSPEGRCGEFADWLENHGLLPFTINGFPYSDFHQPIVKHRVYEPDWTTEDRTRYTLDLAAILARLLGPETEGSISTLPIGWRARIADRNGAADKAATNLMRVARELARVEAETGKLIHVDIEPEPGCYIDSSRDVVEFFEKHLLRNDNEEIVRRHLRVCHDICHTAVMFEDQAQAMRNYDGAGISVGKIQVSSAVRLPLGEMVAGDRRAALAQLGRFAEDRYLHQTVIRDDDGHVTFFEDLPQALSAAASGEITGDEWRVHFHVPLFLDRFGLLRTTRDDVFEALTIAERSAKIHHFEAETYAWNVLPAELQRSELADGIAEELDWLRNWKTAAELA